jgi:hypothetical protein
LRRFGVTVLGRRVFTSSPPALGRRFIAFP